MTTLSVIVKRTGEKEKSKDKATEKKENAPKQPAKKEVKK